MARGAESAADEVLARLGALRQHQQGGRRSPHKPLLVLLVLARMSAVGSSALPWAEAETQLGELIAEYGPASKTGRAQSAAYPFTRLRSDGIWTLDRDVPMDKVGPLTTGQVIGRLEPSLESVLAKDRRLVHAAARALVESHFPATVAPDVLAAVGFDPEAVLHPGDGLPHPLGAAQRRRDPGWRAAILQAWDRQCAFCGYDGQVGGATVGIDAAHVRWFSYDGPDSLDNGLALCALHHKLFDRGVLGLDPSLRVHVSEVYTARTTAGRALYSLHGHSLQARPGTVRPGAQHVAWHRREVFKGQPLAA